MTNTVGRHFSPSLAEQRLKLGEHRDVPAFMPRMVSRLARPDVYFAGLKVYVGPPKGHRFARNSQTAVPGQRDDQFPFKVRCGLHGQLDRFARDELLPGSVLLRAGLQSGKRTLFQQLPINRISEKLPRQHHQLRDVSGAYVIADMTLEVRCIRDSDCADRFILAEEADQLVARLLKHLDAPQFHVGSARDV